MLSDSEKVKETIPDEGLGPQRTSGNGARQFKKMLETHEPKRLRRGQIVEGEIIKLEENLAIVDVGAKRDAIVPPEEMEEVNQSFLDTLDEGDNVYVYVTRTPIGDEELLVSLEKGQRAKDWEQAAEHLDEQRILELKVVGENRGGLLVEFGRLQGFVPNSHVPALARIYDRQERMKQKSKMIDSSIPVKVLEIDRRRKRLVLSAKAAREELLVDRLAELEEGQVVSGRVVNLADYGAFVDLGGVTGLLHVSEMAWHRVEDPGDIVDLGQELEVVITSVDHESQRISLSRKALLPNPWEQFAQRYEIGDLVKGEVTSLVDFGAFVRLPFEIEGLVHISEMRIPASGMPEDALQPGDSIIVRITSILPDEERVGLSMRQVSANEEIALLFAQEEDQEEE